MRKLDEKETPDFYILGPQKTGTSSIFASLSEHPELCGSSKKEPHFFDKSFNFHRGPKWYYKFFENCKGLKFEATPNYFTSPLARVRMKAMGIGKSKTVKFVLFLRDPVDRFVSHYCHFRRYNEIIVGDPIALEEFIKGKSPKSFNPNWRGEPRSLKEVLLKMNREHLIACGEYIANLKHWHALFGEHNFLMIDYNDLTTNYYDVCNRIFDFVGVSPFEAKLYYMNKDSYWEERSGLEINVSEEQVAAIKNHYRPYNEALFEYIDKDLGWNN